MTILPKKKSSGTPKGSDHLHRDPPGSQNPEFQLSNQSVVPGNGGNNGWGPNVAPGSSSGWSPPPVSGGSSSQRWSTSSGSISPGSPDFVESPGSKRPSPVGPYVDDASGGPPASKRRLCERTPIGQSGSNVGAQSAVGQTPDSSVVQSGSVVRGGVLLNGTGPVLSPAGGMSPRSASPPQPGTSQTVSEGYNSEDEYSHLGVALTEEEWVEKDRRFERALKKKGYLITKMTEDGSCLFRAVADQIYGDQEMHPCVRQHCMDYIAQNAEYFSQYVTEDFADYIERKRYLGVHGNHLEIQALSEMYNRPIHIYCYSTEPINIFQGMMKNEPTESHLNAPIRLCYHRGVHYNSIVDPQKATIGVGLGLPGMVPGSADRSLLNQAYRASEDVLVERTMLEDKIKATDWEATNEAIEEQVARESYLQWLRDNERRNKSQPLERSSTVTSGELRAEALRARSPKANSPKPGCSSMLQASSNSPKAGCSFFKDRDSPKPSESSSSHRRNTSGFDYGLGSGFQLLETASFLNGLPPDMFGLEDWSETDVLTQVIAASQQEYLDSLKKKKETSTGGSGSSGSGGGPSNDTSPGDSSQDSKDSSDVS